MLKTTRLAGFAVAVGLFAALLAGAGVASAQTTVNVTLTDPVSSSEFDLIADATSAPEGEVTFQITNEGGIDHDFVVIRTDLPIDQLPMVEKDNTIDLSQVDVVGSTPVIPKGGSDSLTLNMSAGRYILLCNVPGHWSNMNAAFQVTGQTQPTTPATQPTNGGTGGTGTTPSATTGVTGLGDTGMGPADDENGGWLGFAALASALLGLGALGALALRRAR
jgi:uncharacterized cupredoxin-like copper-binding protein